MKIVAINSEQTLSIRHQVLWPHKTPEFCKVPDDLQAWHFAVVKDRQIITVASLYPDGDTIRLRKFATLPEFQGQGAGSLIIDFFLTDLTDKGFKTFWFDARASAVDFYTRFGFSIEGECFYKSDVAYYKMSRQL
ncbi:MAG: GNAT family N-acetyltransferase [Psychromonas sp.]